MNIEFKDIIVAIISSGAGYAALFGKNYLQKSKRPKNYDEIEAEKWRNGFNAIREEFESIKNILVPSVVPEWRKDSAGKIVYVNQAFEVQMLLPLGLTAMEVHGEHFDQVFKEYGEFVKKMKATEEAVKASPALVAVAWDVMFPERTKKRVVIKEVSYGADKNLYYVGRAYEQSLFAIKQGTSF